MSWSFGGARSTASSARSEPGSKPFHQLCKCYKPTSNTLDPSSSGEEQGRTARQFGIHGGWFARTEFRPAAAGGLHPEPASRVAEAKKHPAPPRTQGQLHSLRPPFPPYEERGRGVRGVPTPQAPAKESAETPNWSAKAGVRSPIPAFAPANEPTPPSLHNQPEHPQRVLEASSQARERSKWVAWKN